MVPALIIASIAAGGALVSLLKKTRPAEFPPPVLGERLELVATDGSHHTFTFKQAGAGAGFVADSIDTANRFAPGDRRVIKGFSWQWQPGLNAFVQTSARA